MRSDNLQLPHITSNFLMITMMIVVMVVMLVLEVVVNLMVMVDRTGKTAI